MAHHDHVLTPHTRQPMNSETAETVETSDSEERIDLEALSQSYWQRFYPGRSDVRSDTFSADTPGSSWTKDENSDDDPGAPHKRIKVC
jgi:hypothetical protein